METAAAGNKGTWYYITAVKEVMPFVLFFWEMKFETGNNWCASSSDLLY
jgi:hypothetical protein